jgi:hypothetical protein
MIVTGASIATKDDPLRKIKVEYFFYKIKQPNPDIESRIRQLRVIKQLDYQQYAQLKRKLPYVVCGMFNPSFRRSENFAYTEYFILDIDKIEEKGLNITELKRKICEDTRLVLCFVSPGEDGLKLMFRLAERCYDAGVYAVFYKEFSRQFSVEYSLEQVIDVKTSDVTRACFVSMDAEAYYNPLADSVDMSKFVNIHDTSELLRQKKKLELEFPVKADQKEKEIFGPDEEAIFKIKSLLNPRYKEGIPRKEVVVPPALDEIMTGLVSRIEEAGVGIVEIINIQFGKKIQLQAGLKLAEINLFYGKRGFSVVISPRKGTNDELNSLMSALIDQYIHSVT